MNNAVFINALDLSEFAFRPVFGGADAFSRILETAGRFPGVKDVYVLNRGDLDGSSGDFISVESDINDMHQLFTAVRDHGNGYDNLFYLYGDTPLVDSALVQRMYSNHLEYFASYTFADGYPYGLAAEILKADVLPRLVSLAEKHPIPISRDGIFGIIQKDINYFDIETEISRIDQRMLRISLSCDTKRNFNQLLRIIEAGGRDESSVVEVIEARSDILRGEPAFVNVQVSGGCPQSCSYCPYPVIKRDAVVNRDFMPVERWKTILAKVSDYSDDAVFSISLWGEPSLHPDIDELVRLLLEYPKFSLVIETSGIGWKKEVIDAIKADDDGRVTWILSLDGENQEIYKALRGDGWEEAVSSAEYLHSLFGDRFYVQSVRMNSNEEFLEKFYRRWKERGVNTIIQKYDNFCGVLSDEKVTDISPVRRYPCWHIKRDLVILIDGTVPMCREDLSGDYSLGNIFEEDLPVVWERGADIYGKHSEGEYPGICRDCDEYYTYNF